jgi:hypothetical protein
MEHPEGDVLNFELFWVYDAIPVRYSENSIEFLLREDDVYGATCSRLGADVDYTTRVITIFAITDESDPTGQDSLLTVRINPENWPDIEARIGTLEENKQRIKQAKTNAMLEGSKLRTATFSEPGINRKIMSFLGGSRNTRKKSKKQKRSRRRRRSN